MIKKLLLLTTVVLLVLAATGSVLYVRNVAPAVPVIPTEAIPRSNKPFVVKLHAQWCAVCMVTKGAWSQIEETYAGRVHLVVLDFTTSAATEASRAEATRLGLQKFFDEYGGATGTVAVLDGRTREVTASIDGSRDFSAYRTAIDAALKGEQRR